MFYGLVGDFDSSLIQDNHQKKKNTGADDHFVPGNFKPKNWGRRKIIEKLEVRCCQLPSKTRCITQVFDFI